MDNYKLGLGDPPTTVYLYVAASDKTEDGSQYPWHTYDFDTDRKTVIKEPALSGFLKEISMKKSVYKDKEGFKVRFRFSTPREYVIQSGVETTFTSNLLTALLKWEDFSKPMCVQATVGDQGKVVFSSLWTLDGQLIIGEKGDQKMLPIINELQRRLGNPVQTIEDVRKAYDDAQDSRYGGNR